MPWNPMVVSSLLHNSEQVRVAIFRPRYSECFFRVTCYDFPDEIRCKGITVGQCDLLLA